MLCILCVTLPKKKPINIFDEDGIALKIGTIIRKHFWLKPNINDDNAKIICSLCWESLDSFDKFYTMVEETHAALTNTEIGEEEIKEESLSEEEDDDNAANDPDPKQPDTEKSGDKNSGAVTMNPQPLDTDKSVNDDSAAREEENDEMDDDDFDPESEVNKEIDLSGAVTLKQLDAQKSVNDDAAASKEIEDEMEDDDSDPDSEVEKGIDLSGAVTLNLQELDTQKSVNDDSAASEDNEDAMEDVGSGPAVSGAANLNPQQLDTEKSVNEEHDDRMEDIDSDCDSDVPLARLITSKKKPEKAPKKRKPPVIHNRISGDLPGWNATCFAEEESNQRITIEQSNEFIEKNIDLSCTICSEKLDTFNLLLRHYDSVHHVRGYASCCGKKLEKRCAVVDHILLHKYPEYFTCETCHKFFKSRRNLREHLKIHDKSISFKCEICDKSFNKAVLLRRHMDHHVKNPTIKCDKCDKLFPSKFALGTHNFTAHKRGHHRVCDICGKVTRTRDSFRLHQMKHTGEKREKLECKICGLMLASKSCLSRHEKSKHGEPEEPKKCEICGVMKGTAFLLKKHIFYAHKCKPKFKCERCGRGFKTRINLKPNSEDTNATAICSSCWEALESFHKFYEMVEESHIIKPLIKDEETDVKPSMDDGDTDVDSMDLFDGFLASDIKSNSSHNTDFDAQPTVDEKTDDTTLPSHNLRNRTQPAKDDDSVSANEEETPEKSEDKDYDSPKSKTKPKANPNDRDLLRSKISCKEFDNIIKEKLTLSCEICNTPLASFFALKTHYRSVHDETGYVTCCDKKFDSRHALVHHVLLHQNPDTFKCPVCGRIMANKKSFTYHTKTHLNSERIYKCDKCKKSFTREARLERHMQTHEKIQQICELCGKVTPNKHALRHHKVRNHSGVPKQRLECKKCGAYLADASTLHTHMKYQHPKTEDIYKCNICGKISTSGYGLKRHIAYMHRYERSHKCTVCEKGFKTAQRLRVSSNIFVESPVKDRSLNVSHSSEIISPKTKPNSSSHLLTHFKCKLVVHLLSLSV